MIRNMPVNILIYSHLQCIKVRGASAVSLVRILTSFHKERGTLFWGNGINEEEEQVATGKVY